MVGIFRCTLFKRISLLLWLVAVRLALNVYILAMVRLWARVFWSMASKISSFADFSDAILLHNTRKGGVGSALHGVRAIQDPDNGTADRNILL
jgi:hypothetical protein